jgi:hypothetical protein
MKYTVSSNCTKNLLSSAAQSGLGLEKVWTVGDFFHAWKPAWDKHMSRPAETPRSSFFLICARQRKFEANRPWKLAKNSSGGGESHMCAVSASHVIPDDVAKSRTAKGAPDRNSVRVNERTARKRAPPVNTTTGFGAALASRINISVFVPMMQEATGAKGNHEG